MQILFKSLVALTPVAVFFYLYFNKFFFDRGLVLLHAKDFFLGVMISAGALLLQRQFGETDLPWLRAFVYSALTEEALRYLLLYVVITRFSRDFSTTEGIFSGVMIGLGFSFAENILFSFKFSAYVILMRCMSSAPLHVLCGAIMGFHLAYANLCKIPKRYISLMVAGFLIPWLYHSAFNFALFKANQWLYLVPVLIIVGYVFVEGLIERARLIFGHDVLEATEHDADSMDVLIKQKEYERYMFDAQLRRGPKIKLFNNRWRPRQTIVALALILISGALFYSLRFDSYLVDQYLKKNQAIRALVVGLPLTIGVLFLLSEKINFNFLREIFFRTPKGTMVSLIHKGEVHDSIVFDIFSFAVFVSGIFEVQRGDPMKIRFYRRKSSFDVPVRLVWLNNSNTSQPVGVLVSIRRLSFFFWLFRIKYQWQKLRRGMRLSYEAATDE